MTPLDKRLQELALLDWEAFCALTQIDKTHAEVCLLRFSGLSIGQIAQKLTLTRSKVQRLKKECGSQNNTVTATA